MHFEWDDAKNESNRSKHGLGFEEMERFDWDSALLLRQETVDAEERDTWVGPLPSGVVAVVVTERGDVTRIISLRYATTPEKKRWRSEL